MKIFIYACENFYGGLHGIEDYYIDEFETYNGRIISNIGTELSQDVIENYINVDEDYLDCNGAEDFDSEDDYWAGAVKQCGGVSKMPTMAQLLIAFTNQPKVASIRFMISA